MITVADAQRVILKEVGAGLEGLPDEILAEVMDHVTLEMPTLWEMWAWKANVWPGLQALYVKRACIDILLGQDRDFMSVSIGGTSVPQATLFQNLTALRTNVCQEIDRVEKQAYDSRPMAMGVMNNPPVLQDRMGRPYIGTAGFPPPGRAW